MKSAILSLITCLLLLTIALPQSHAQKAKFKGVTYCEFTPGTFPLHAHSMPKAVVNAVMNSPESKQELPYADGKPSDSSPEKLLLGRKIRLSTDGANVFLVIGSGVLSAADGSWFWIVREKGTKASILLFTAANCVSLDSTETRGYRNVDYVWASAGTEQTGTYRYDGKVYKLAHSESRSRGPND